MKIGFIGAGNMAGAIIRGLVQSSLFPSQDIWAYDLDSQKTKQLEQDCSVQTAGSLNDLLSGAQIVVLAVKPIVFPALLPQISSRLSEENPLLISIAAGKTLDFIQSFLPDQTKIVRVMPNINAKVGCATSAYCKNQWVGDSDCAVVERIFSCIGSVMPLSEESFPLFGVLAGCAPAFAYQFIDALARAGVKNGMAKQTALEIAAQTVMGSAKMILESGEHPWALIDQVCSPGGTTIEGVLELKKDGFETAVQNAVDAAVEKDRRL